MRTLIVLLLKELRSFFYSPVAWVVMAMFMAICGMSFAYSINILNTKPSEFSIVRWSFFPPWFWFQYFFIFPLITMRLFSEEQKLGTLESLLTAPVKTWHVLMAKYFASLFFYIVLWLPVLLYFGVLHYIMRGRVEIPAGALWGSYIMILASGMFHLAIGCLASSLTKNQIISAVITYGLLLLHFLAGTSLLSASSQTVSPVLQDKLRTVVNQAVLQRHMDYFTSGLVDTRPLVYYISSAVLLLFITHQVLEYRRWKT